MDDSPEPEVCEKKVEKPLVVPGPRAIELSSRSSSGRDGIGRRRRSTQCLGGLPTRGCDGQVARSSGSEETAGSTGSVTSTGQRRGGTPVLRTSSEGPLSLIPMRALLQFSSTELRGNFCRLSVVRRELLPVSAHWSGPLAHRRRDFLWRSRCELWRTAGGVVDDPEELAVRRSSAREPLVRPGREPVELLPRTPSGESGIGRRRRSVPSPPASRRGWRWPGDEVIGIARSRLDRPGASPVPVER